MLNEVQVFNPINLSAEEKDFLQKGMQKAFVDLQRAAKARYGFPNVKKLRDEFRVDPAKSILSSDPEAEKSMEWMISQEKRILSGYIRLGLSICSTFKLSIEKKKTNFSDCMQVVALAIYDGMYQYNGSTEFSTYAFWLIKNKLITFCRLNQSSKGITGRILKLKAEVLNLTKIGFTTEQAINRLRDSGKITDVRHVEKLKLALGMNCDDNITEIASPTVDQDAKDEIQLMRNAIDQTNLSEMERNLLEAHLNGDVHYRKHLSETLINKTTGKLWTKQRLSQLFLRACEKARETYETKIPSKAA